MKRDGRWDAQRNLANRIARITTRILPSGEGVALRFINQDVDNSSSLNYEQIGNIINSTNWGGDTPIGTSLRSKILQPMVYDKIQRNEKISRPILVSIITDGMPEPEPRNTLVNEIAECGDRLKAAGYDRASTCFLVLLGPNWVIIIRLEYPPRSAFTDMCYVRRCQIRPWACRYSESGGHVLD